MRVAIIVDRDLPRGLLANCAAALAFSVSPRVPGGVGPDARDGSGGEHKGITSVPIPILASDRSGLKEIRDRAAGLEGVSVLDFTTIAQGSLTYDEYVEALAAAPAEELAYIGLCVFGETAGVRKATGSLPLLR
jgi:hypothetical protein